MTNVQLYVYDLSRGLARQFSLGLTGVQIDAIYHTSVVFGGVEYFFGQGIHRKIPGSTHHGKPIEVIHLGKTDLPMDVIYEYIESLASIYTAESYDLFLHNCNNFSQDLSMFLVGKDIPEQIRTLPQKFLETPIGQMLKTQIDQSMRAMTQAPDAEMPTMSKYQRNGFKSQNTAVLKNGDTSTTMAGVVHNVTEVHELDRLLESARNTCAVIFFTSATCPPCKIVYPAYDQLAAEAGSKAVLIKVDVSKAHAIGMRYSVRVTPTFISFLKGVKENEWSGANEAQLRGNVQLLLQMASPHHPHERLSIPSLHRPVTETVKFPKIPPLDKLVAKIGSTAKDPAFSALVNYVKEREKSGRVEAPLPNLRAFSEKLEASFHTLPTDVHFAVIDLVRVASADSRVGSYFITEPDQKTLQILFQKEKHFSQAPYNIKVVTLQLACNLFLSPVFREQLASAKSVLGLRNIIENLATSCLLAPQSNARFFASALVYNLASLNHNERLEGHPDKFDLNSNVDLGAALVEAVINERESKETLHGLLSALGLMLYGTSSDSPVWELCIAMEVEESLKEKSKEKIFTGEPLFKEVGEELLGKGAVS